MMMDLLDKHFLYVSDLVGKRTVSPEGRSIGTVTDIVITYKQPYPEISALMVRPGIFRRPLLLPWSSVLPFDHPIKNIPVASGAKLEDRPLGEHEIPICDVFLDKQIVDTDGAKVVRINDLHLLKEDHKVWLVHMDIGVRGFLRRLGWMRIIDTLTQMLVSTRIPNNLLSWKHVQSLPTTSQAQQASSLKLKIVHQKMNMLHPADLSDILKDLAYFERVAIFRSLDAATAAETLDELAPESQKGLIEAADKAKIPDIIAKMSPDKAADLLAHLSMKKKTDILKCLPDELREEMSRLSEHPEQTAGGMMTTDFVSLPPTATVAEAIDKVRLSAKSMDAFLYVFITSPDGVLSGVVTIRRLLLSPPETKLSDIMNSKAKKLFEWNQKDKVVKMFMKYKFGVIPVVDSKSRIKGVILFKDAMSELLPQMEVTLPNG